MFACRWEIFLFVIVEVLSLSVILVIAPITLGMEFEIAEENGEGSSKIIINKIGFMEFLDARISKIDHLSSDYKKLLVKNYSLHLQ